MRCGYEPSPSTDSKLRDRDMRGCVTGARDVRGCVTGVRDVRVCVTGARDVRGCVTGVWMRGKECKAG